MMLPTKLAKDLANALTLKAATEHGIELLAPGGYLDDVIPLFCKVVRRHEAIASRLLASQLLDLLSIRQIRVSYHAFLDRFFDLFYLGLTKAFDLLKLPPGRIVHRL
jgi:hypothetical protein